VQGRAHSGSADLRQFRGGHRRAEPCRRPGRTDGAPRRCDGVLAVARQVRASLDETTCALSGSNAL
jgi:hypothetical protein